MELGQIIAAIIIGLIACALLTYAFFASREKGPILSNTYLFATKHEREHMDKSGEYHMVSVVFGLLGMICVVLAIEILTSWTWLFIIMGILVAAVITYAIVESIKTEIKQKRK